MNRDVRKALSCSPALVAWSYFSKKVEVFAVELEALCDEFIRKQYADKK